MDKKSTAPRTDPYTGETFTPKRNNQFFALPENQIAFNNRKAAIKRKEKANIDKPLDKNRRILKQLLGTEKAIMKSKEFLLGSGYNFRYFTHQVLVENEKADCIYEYVIKKKENQNYLIWKLEY